MSRVRRGFHEKCRTSSHTALFFNCRPLIRLPLQSTVLFFMSDEKSSGYANKISSKSHEFDKVSDGDVLVPLTHGWMGGVRLGWSNYFTEDATVCRRRSCRERKKTKMNLIILFIPSKLFSSFGCWRSVCTVSGSGGEAAQARVPGEVRIGDGLWGDRDNLPSLAEPHEASAR